MSDDKVGIVCGRLDEVPEGLVPDSVVRWCNFCATEVWVAPSTLRLMERERHCEIVCTTCMDGVAQTQDVVDIKPVPEAERANDPNYRMSVRAAQFRWEKKK